MATYVELQVTSHFSFLRGASAPEELFAAAALQGIVLLDLRIGGALRVSFGAGTARRRRACA